MYPFVFQGIHFLRGCYRLLLLRLSVILIKADLSILTSDILNLGTLIEDSKDIWTKFGDVPNLFLKRWSYFRIKFISYSWIVCKLNIHWSMLGSLWDDRFVVKGGGIGASIIWSELFTLPKLFHKIYCFLGITSSRYMIKIVYITQD